MAAPVSARSIDPRMASDLTHKLLPEHENHGGSSSGSLTHSHYTMDGSVDLLGQPAVRSKTGGWRTSAFILGTECCERLAYYGINSNLVMYMTKVLHQGNAMAARNVSLWAGTGYLTPLIGAFLADSFLGRFKTIASFSGIYVIGLCMLALCSTLPWLKPPACAPGASDCPDASAIQLSAFYISLYMIAFGMGGIKPCVSAFGADQFDDEHKSERKKKSHFFNWFYLSINLGSLVSTIAIVYVQDNISWSLGYAIPAAAMIFALALFLVGARFYRHQKPAGSPLTRVAQVLVAAFRKWLVPVPDDESLLFGFHHKTSVIEGSRKMEHTEDFRFLDKAATISSKDSMREEISLDPWRLCTVSEVEEVKQVMRVLPIWASNIFFSTVFFQIYILFVEQGARMDRSVVSGLEIPPGSMSLFQILTVLLMIPIYDRIISKLARIFSGHPHGFTQLQRIGIGLFLATFAMISAFLVESRRLKLAEELGLKDDPVTPVPMSVFWQVPQYSLIGVAETFTYIGQLEFFYEQAPDSMRSLGTALALTTYSIGYYINSVMILLVTRFTGNPGWIPNNLNHGHLDYYFGLNAIINLANFFWYLSCARVYKYKETSSNNIDFLREGSSA